MTAVTVAVLAVWVGIAVLAGRGPTRSTTAGGLGAPTEVFRGGAITPDFSGRVPGAATNGAGNTRRGTSGTIDSVLATTLKVTTPDGRMVTVTTSDATRVSQLIAVPVADIKPGASVVATGTSSSVGHSLVAQRIMVTPPGAGAPTAGGGFTRGTGNSSGPVAGGPNGVVVGGPAGGGTAPDQVDIAAGTVTAAAPGGLTLTQSDGTVVQVLTSLATASTRVEASITDLHAGQPVTVRGSTNADGTVAASDVQEGDSGLGLAGGVGTAPGATSTGGGTDPPASPSGPGL